jgi:hypothetical protein
MFCAHPMDILDQSKKLDKGVRVMARLQHLTPNIG